MQHAGVEPKVMMGEALLKGGAVDGAQRKVVTVTRVDGVQQLGVETLKLAVIIAPELKTIRIEDPYGDRCRRVNFLRWHGMSAGRTK